MGTLGTIDWFVIALYFLGLVGIVYWSSKKVQSSADYFLAGRDVGFFAVGASLFASNIGSEHIVGLAGSGANSGMAMAHYELHAWIMILLAWVFVPFYYRSKVFTMPEFLERRFDSRSRWVLSIVSLLAYVFTKVSVTVYAGAKVFETLLPDTFGSPENAFLVGALSTVVLTGIYTVMGGLRAVVYTEVLQTFVLILGSVFITWFGLQQLGGWSELKMLAVQNKESFALWRPNSDSNFPWLGIMIASPVVGIWYWCTDQYIVQRTLSARSLKEARRGAIWGGFLKVWPVFIFLIPGMIGWALHQKGIMIIPSKSGGGLDGDQVFPMMVANLLPVGLRGLVVGGLLAALMSSLSSLFNSCATLFTKDIYQKLNPEASDLKLVRVGRFATVIVCGLGIAWIWVMPLISQGGLYEYLQSVQGYLAPPITAVFLLGLFCRRINAQGAFIGLVAGFILGMLKLFIQGLVNGEVITGPAFLVWFGEFNFLYYTGTLFLISVIVVVAISLMTPAPSDAQVAGLTYGSLTDEDRDEIRSSWGWAEVFGTIVVLGLVMGVYLYFSFWLG
jgi:SSS family solute:Na+ symporter